jgi:UDP-3-O-[3-hydroxymyristoyl] glucosamine N-acyltransferase
MKVQEIASLLEGEVAGEGGAVIKGVNALATADEGDLSFYSDPRYRGELEKTKASALLVAEKTGLFKGAQIIVRNPAFAFAKVAALFAPPLPRFPGISHQAFLDEDAALGKDVSVYPFVYVGKGSSVGDGSILYPGVFVGEGVRIGKGCILHPNVVVMHGCILGNNVIVHAGSVIGSDGFGFVRDGGPSVKVPQLGIVQIDDDVEIGANNCIDRAALGRTWIKRGVKTDNLVQIAHNVVVGEDSIIVALSGIAGSSVIGRQVIIAGQVGVGDHLEIGDRVTIGPKAGVAKSISSGEVVLGAPAMPYLNYMRCNALFARLPELFDRLRRLEHSIAEKKR